MSDPRAHTRSTRDYLAKTRPNNKFEVGDHTYGHPEIQEPGASSLRIGRYCSIADKVTIILANHRTDLVTTYPFCALRRFWPEAPHGINDHDWPGPVEIGSDVWIGFGVTIMPGVKIGHGSIIAAQSVVTKPVAPYSIVAGVPAKQIRLRYEESIIERLLAVAWWDWNDDRVAASLAQLMQPSIEAFLEYAEASEPARESVPA